MQHITYFDLNCVGDIFQRIMTSHKEDVLVVLRKTKEFILDLEGSKLPIKDLCMRELQVPEEKFNNIISLTQNGMCYESDADSDGNMR